MYKILSFLFGIMGDIGSVDRVSFWTFIASLWTLAIAIIAWIGFRNSNKISSADFSIKFRDAFFTPETRKVVSLFYDNDSIKYDKEKDIFWDKNKQVSPYEVDDVLGHFDDLGTFEKKGIVDIFMVYELFDTYIEKIRKNKSIKEYIKSERENPDDEDIYDNYDYIYCKCRSYGETKRAHKNLIIWRLKWILCNRCIIKKNLKAL